MGFKALSTTRSGAASVVSRQATIVNTNQGFAVSGSAITSNTTINTEVVTPGQGTNVDPVSGGIAITSINYLNANGSISTANAVSTTGGNIKINGSGFSSPMTVVVGGTTISNANVTVANTTAIIANLGSSSPGNVTVYAFNASGTGAQLVNGVFYSGAPTWTTSSVNFQNGTSANVQLVASSDSTLTYTLQAGSSLPTGISLISTGYLSGTATGYSTNTSSSAVIVATDLEGQATQQTITWTVAVSDPQFPYVTLLLNGDTGNNISNGATNNTFLDSSTNNFSITRTGTTTQGSFTPFSQTGWSNYIATMSGDAGLYLGGQAAFSFGTGDFTIEMWVNLQSVTSLQVLIDFRPASTNGLYPTVYLDTATQTLRFFTNNADVITGATTFTYNTWHHVAVSRASGSTKMFLDGVQQGSTYSDSNNYIVGANRPYTGYGVSGTGYKMYGGYLSNLRIMKGQALYTSAFTPSTATLTTTSQGANAANVSLLTAQSNRFVDNSSNGFTINVVGSLIAQSFSPFSPTSTYSTGVNGGSAYLDGSGNYLSIPTNAALNITSGSTDSFVCEGWFYWATVTASTSLVENGGVNPTSFPNWAITLNASSQITLSWGNSAAPGSSIGVLPSTVVPIVGQWYHIALVKTNADWSLFINGTNKTAFSGLNTAAKTSATPLYIGYGLASSANGTAFKGYVSNLRVYKGATGSAPYSATASTITVPSSPVTAITNTQLLTDFTNGGIVDAHSTNNFQTVGSTQLSTVVKKYGSASMYFDGNGDWLQFPSLNQTIAFNTGDFTVECWVNFAANNGTYNPFVRYDGSGTFDFGYDFSVSQLKYNGATALIATAWTPTVGTWYHLALSRASGSSRMFVNGTQVGTTVTGDTNNYATGAFKVGGSSFSSGHVMNGYIDDLRITRGFARYTANFTAPTSQFQGQ